MIQVSVLGLGFVGLTTAVGFANHNIITRGFDINDSKRNVIKQGTTPFVEEGLDDALKRALDSKMLTISNTITECLSNSDVIFLCMGTPMSEDGSADLSYILSALDNVVENLNATRPNPIVIIKSTVPPSSTQNIFKKYLENKGLSVSTENSNLRIANNPEFLREGFAYSDFMNPDRVVIGTLNGDAYPELEEIYKPFKAPIIFTNLNTAEFIKYLSNTTLSTLISYANDMSLVAQSIGDIDIKNAFNILSMDKRFDGSPAKITTYLYPGLGYGGYCLPKDTLALYKKANENGYESKILKSVIDINNSITNNRMQEVLKTVSKDETICILGLSFKPGSDDVRDSRSKLVIDILQQSGYKNIIAYDPISIEIFKKTYGIDIDYDSDLASTVNRSSCLIIATAWSDIIDYVKKINNKKIFDFRFI